MGSGRCECVCLQERELIMLPGTRVRVNNAGVNMGNQLWEFSLCVDDEEEQMIDFKHPHWGFPDAAKATSKAKVYVVP